MSAFRTLLLGTSLSLLPFASAVAQSVLFAPPPAHYIVDERGVDVVAGTFNLSTTDVVMGPADQGGMAYSRTFAGTGWRDSLTSAIEQVSTSTVIVSIGGYSEVFDKSGTTYTPTIPRGSRLVETSSTTLTWTWADGTVVVFDKTLSTGFSPIGGNFGRATSITRPNGEKTELHYQQVVIEDTVPIQRAVRLLSAWNNRGYRLDLAYEMMSNPTTSEQFGAWTRVTGVYGRNLAVDHCEPDFCYSVAGPRPYATYVTGDGYSTVTNAIGETVRYEYFGPDRRMTGIRLPGSASNDVSITYSSNRVSSVQTGGSTWSYAYEDASGVRTTTITDPMSGVSKARSNISAFQLNSFSDPLNNTTTYAYNAGRVSQIVLPRGNSVSYAYDGRGNITQTTAIPVPPSGLEPIISHASFPATCANPVTCNLPTSTTDATGNVTDYTWDSAHGGPLTITQPAPTTGADRPQTRYAYAPQYAWYKNSSGVLAQAPTPVTLPTAVSTCSTGTAPTCVGTADEVRTTLTYGSSGVANNLLPTAVSQGSGVAPAMAVTASTYTPNGDIETVDGPLAGAGDTTRYRFDNVRRVVGVVGPDPDGAGALLNRAQRLTYSPRGQVTLTEIGTTPGYTDPNWTSFNPLARSATIHDDRGRPLVTSQQSGTGTTVAVQQVSYDAAGRPECTAVRMNPAAWGALPPSACTATTVGGSGPDRITRVTYDAAGRLLSTTTAYGLTEAATTSLTYTANGQVASLTDGNNNVSIQAYDGFDRPATLRYPNPTGGGTSTTDYEQVSYDTDGRMVASRNRAGQVTNYTFDALGRTTLIDAPSGTADTHYRYDLLGRPTSISQTGALPVVCDSQTTCLAWDALSRQTSETTGVSTMSYQYDAAGHMTRLTWRDGFYAQYDRNLYGEVTAIRERGAASGAGVLASYAYNNLGQTTGIARGNGTATAWSYDAAGRMTGLSQDLAGTANDVVFGYGWNPAGQIASRTVSNAAYVNAPAVTLTSYLNNGRNQVTSAGGTAVTYDVNQNIATALGNTYGYDAAGRLTSTSTTTLGYDPSGRLYSSSSTGARFAYAGVQLTGEYDSAGNLVTRHVPGPGLDQTIASYSGAGDGADLWLMADERGSVINLANSAGTTLNVNRYDEYGVPAAANSDRFQYTGQAMIEPGLYNYRARAYAPQLGRFLQTDPIGYQAGVNVYAYVRGDPVNRNDPSGLQMVCWSQIVGTTESTENGIPVFTNQYEGRCFDLGELYSWRDLFGGGDGGREGRPASSPAVQYCVFSEPSVVLEAYQDAYSNSQNLIDATGAALSVGLQQAVNDPLRALGSAVRTSSVIGIALTEAARAYNDYSAGYSVPVIAAGVGGRVTALAGGGAAGAGLGSLAGLAGGPFAEVTVPAGATFGATIGGAAVGVAKVDVAFGQWAQEQVAQLNGTCYR